MSKVYRYRKHLRYMQKLCPVFFLFLMIIDWIAGITIYYQKPTREVFQQVLILEIITTFIFVTFAIVFWFLFKKFTKVSVRFEDDLLIYENAKGIKEIPIQDITKVSFPSLRYMGGWIKIITKDNYKIRLTVVIEKIGDFLEELKNKLDKYKKNDKNEIYSPRKFFNFYKTAVFSDNSWERVYGYFVKYLLITILHIILNLGLAVFSWKAFPNLRYLITNIRLDFMGFIILAIGIAVILPLVIFIIVELVLIFKMSKKVDFETFYCPKRDIIEENKIYNFLFYIYAILYFCAVVFFLIFFKG